MKIEASLFLETFSIISTDHKCLFKQIPITGVSIFVLISSAFAFLLIILPDLAANSTQFIFCPCLCMFSVSYIGFRGILVIYTFTSNLNYPVFVCSFQPSSVDKPRVAHVISCEFDGSWLKPITEIVP